MCHDDGPKTRGKWKCRSSIGCARCRHVLASVGCGRRVIVDASGLRNRFVRCLERLYTLLPRKALYAATALVFNCRCVSEVEQTNAVRPNPRDCLSCFGNGID